MLARGFGSEHKLNPLSALQGTRGSTKESAVTTRPTIAALFKILNIFGVSIEHKLS
jgi:hypothetical protein